MVLYPFTRNDLTPRTHDSYVNAAREAQRRSKGDKDVSILGIKGFSTLFEVRRTIVFFPEIQIFEEV